MPALNQLPPINGSNPQSFAHFTIRKRIPHILEKVIEQYPSESPQRKLLEQLQTEIPDSNLRLLSSGHKDQSIWNKILTDYRELNWFDAPFFLAESYFYRRIMEAIEYFNPSGPPEDPFFEIKHQDIMHHMDFMSKLAFAFQSMKSRSAFNMTDFNRLLLFSLWGNKSDLSQLDTDRDTRVDLDQQEETLSQRLLINDAGQLADMFHTALPRIDLVGDNAGVELFTDLLLIYYLLSYKKTNQLFLHLKPYPTFVSDATTTDLFNLVNHLENSKNADLINIAKHIHSWIQNQQLILRADYFWNLPLSLYQILAESKSHFDQSGLVILKGDANYRRLLGDKQVPYDDGLNQWVNYLKAPVLCLRILKSEIITGLDPEKIKKLDQADPEWLFNSRYGLLQLRK